LIPSRAVLLSTVGSFSTLFSSRSCRRIGGVGQLFEQRLSLDFGLDERQLATTQEEKLKDRDQQRRATFAKTKLFLSFPLSNDQTGQGKEAEGETSRELKQESGLC
jgi:hypothetical protein